MKKKIFALVFCSLFLTSVASADQFSPYDGTIQPGQSIVGLSEHHAGVVAGSELIAVNTDTQAQTLCADYELSGPCNFAAPQTGVLGWLLMPVCTNPAQDNCVAALSIGDSKSSAVPATFVGQAPGPTVSADRNYGLPEGSTNGLWTSPTKNADGTNTYATQVMVQLNFNSSTKKFTFSNVNVDVLPYSLTSGNYITQVFNQGIDSNGHQYVGGLFYNGPVKNQNCAWTGPGVCGAIQDFNPGTFVELQLRLSNQIGGWFQGRMENPSMSVSSFDSVNNLVKVGALSTQVAGLRVVAASSDPGILAATSGMYKNATGAANDVGVWWDANQPQAILAVDDLRTTAKNTATAMLNLWGFGTVPTAGITNSCLANTSQILGIVTTNSMAYDGGVPTYTNGFLEYKVAGMHYMPDGVTPVQGTYDMVMADSVARCLYGFSNAPISGTVSVSEDSSGVQSVATTSVNDAGGWIHLAAYNFHFSDPVIKAKLSQIAPVVIAAPASKTTITCMNIKNKKLIKKITAVKPVCPAGYKKV